MTEEARSSRPNWWRMTRIGLTSTAKITQPARMPNRSASRNPRSAAIRTMARTTEPVARREAPAAADAPIPHEFGSELDQQSPQDEAMDITYHLSAAHQHSQVRVPPRTPQRLGAPRR